MTAALVVAAPVALLAVGGGDDADVANDPPAGAWRTVTHGDARADIPGDWTDHTCDFDGFTAEVYGPDEKAACQFESYLAFYGSATFDARRPPGIFGKQGYVYAGDFAVSAATETVGLTRRLLASARSESDPPIDGSEWQTVGAVGLRYDVPAFWGLGPDADLSNYAVCAVTGDRDAPPTEREDEPATYGSTSFVADRWIQVVAPTQALADLVTSTVRVEPRSDDVGCVSGSASDGDEGTSGPTDDWQRFAVEGVRFDVPDPWRELDCPGSGIYFGPDPNRCGRNDYLTFYARAWFDPAMGPAEIVSGHEGGDTLWAGYVFAGDWAVYVRTYDPQLTQDILATVR
ncbi:hypothetical protein DJ010_03765 [Nocardioides silvaticus]|uniref:Uncharacterized protein n=1 Tax=Nocardioides silvaticus TaxID=2201891 RepID=A0A316TR79_9ACTN|nr:hypothetical protein [Nocardioides silvaticus]PWN04742.1 hypothetical protein DJ010_03765 [Nocardioides silvaticus]